MGERFALGLTWLVVKDLSLGSAMLRHVIATTIVELRGAH
jgi:hypothetical protein